MKGQEDDYEHLERVEIEGREQYFRTSVSYNEYISSAVESEMDDFVADFTQWIYKRLEAEHDHLTSDETVEEAIKSSELLFDEFGETI